MQRGGHFAQLVKQFQSEQEEEEKKEEGDGEARQNGAGDEGVTVAAAAADSEQVVGEASSSEAQAIAAPNEYMRERTQSEVDKRRLSSAAAVQEKPQKPNQSNSKLMTSEESATGMKCTYSYNAPKTYEYSTVKYDS